MRTVTGRWAVGCIVCVWCSRPRFVGGSAERDRPAQPADPVPPARAPQSPDEERSGRQLCQMHNCGQLLIGKVAARGRAGEPDKAGATSEKSCRIFVGGVS